MKYTYTQFDGSLALAMIEQALTDDNIKRLLAAIAKQLGATVLIKLQAQELAGLNPNLSTLAMQHSAGDKFIGALLPEQTQYNLAKTAAGRNLLLAAIEQCLSTAAQITTVHQFLALMKTLDGMAFVYDELLSSDSDKEKRDKHIHCRNYIAPTADETAIRGLRAEQLAVSYGIGTTPGVDLLNKADAEQGCFSGKARFFILPIAQRKRIWFEKLADQSSLGRPALPLIASPSNAAAKNFLMANGLELFVDEQGLFNFAKGQIFANCLMAYLVYCGHHSFLEVAEIWNRQIDFVVLKKKTQVAKDIFPEEPSSLAYINTPDAVERKLPYVLVGDYASFLHSEYADQVMQRAHEYLTEGLNLNFNADLPSNFANKQGYY